MIEFDEETKQLLASNLKNISKMKGKYQNWRFWLDDEEVDVIAELLARIRGDKDSSLGSWSTQSSHKMLSDMINGCLPNEDASKSCSAELVLSNCISFINCDLTSEQMDWVSDTAKELLENENPDIDKIIKEIENRFLGDGQYWEFTGFS